MQRALSIIDENILLYIKIFDRSLLFYTGMIGAISSFSRSLIKNPEDTIYKPTKYMKKIQGKYEIHEKFPKQADNLINYIKEPILRKTESLISYIDPNY